MADLAATSLIADMIKKTEFSHLTIFDILLDFLIQSSLGPSGPGRCRHSIVGADCCPLGEAGGGLSAIGTYGCGVRSSRDRCCLAKGGNCGLAVRGGDYLSIGCGGGGIAIWIAVWIIAVRVIAVWIAIRIAVKRGV